MTEGILLRPRKWEPAAPLVRLVLRCRRGGRRKLAAAMAAGDTPPRKPHLPPDFAVTAGAGYFPGRTDLWELPGDGGRLPILYLPGGAFVSDPTAFHWQLVRLLGEKTGRRVLVSVYPKAPEHTVFDTLENLLEIWHAACPEGAILMGDSAGATLSLLLAANLRDRGEPGPERMILLAPAGDMSLSSPAIDALAPRDPMLEPETVRVFSRLYTGSHARDPGVSPLETDLRGLCPVEMIFGDQDILLPDGELLYQKLRREGTPVTMEVWPGMMHVFPLLPGLRAAKQVREKIVSIIRSVS